MGNIKSDGPEQIGGIESVHTDCTFIITHIQNPIMIIIATINEILYFLKNSFVLILYC